MEDRSKPTPAQIDMAHALMNELGHDPDWYDVKSMTRAQLADKIRDWRKELEEREEEPQWT